MKRKIAAIFAADIAGYSRLVAEDEEETLGRLGSGQANGEPSTMAIGHTRYSTAGSSTIENAQPVLAGSR